MKTKIEIKEDIVIKHCNSLEEYQNELMIYQMNLDITPKLLGHYSDMRIALDRIEGKHPSKITHFFLCLECLVHFHTLTQNLSLCHTDPNPGNFICTKDQAYLIDFSQIEKDNPARDIIAFCLFLVDILPIEDLDQIGMFFKNNYSDLYEFNTEIVNEECVRFDLRRKEFKKIIKLSFEQKAKRQRILSFLIDKEK